jgi:hypothetical protein
VGQFMIRRSLAGAVAGSITALSASALLDYALFGHGAVMRGQEHCPDSRFLLASIGLSALAGAFMGGPVGAVRLNKTAAGAVRGVLWGVAATVLMGLVSSCEYGPKVGEGHKLIWLIYGVPSGALIGAFFGAVIARWMSYHSADSGEGGRATHFCHDPDRDQHSLRTGR